MGAKPSVNNNNITSAFNPKISSLPVVYTEEPFLKYKPILSELVSPVRFASNNQGKLFAVDQIGIIYIYDPNIAKFAQKVTVNPNDGTIYHFPNGKTRVTKPFLDLRNEISALNPIYDERGLLDMVFHPNKDNFFYLWYSVPTNQPSSNYSHDMVFNEWIIVNDIPQKNRTFIRWSHPERNHNGGTILFHPKNNSIVFLSTGDGGGAGDQHGTIGNSQDPESPWGKIWVFDISNPIVEYSLYTLGLRNPWRMSFNQKNDIILGDVGQNLYEGVHQVSNSGENHGWRAWENGHVYDVELAQVLSDSKINVTFPVLWYGREIGASVIGGYFLNQKNYVFGDFIGDEKHDNVFLWDGNNLLIQPKSTKRLTKFVNSFSKDKQGNIYVLSKNKEGPSGTTGMIHQLEITKKNMNI